jgi:hypothetical protein
MNNVNKFYLKHAVYEIEVRGVTSALLLDYAANRYQMVGEQNSTADEIAKLLLSKKHNVNFAYKFNGKIDEENL